VSNVFTTTNSELTALQAEPAPAGALPPLRAVRVAAHPVLRARGGVHAPAADHHDVVGVLRLAHVGAVRAVDDAAAGNDNR
jgi:hypothetical protein